MHWLEIQIVSGLHRKKSLKRYLAQNGDVKIMPDCLVSAKKVPECLCYSFQHFISKRVPTGKLTHEYTINQRSDIIGLKTEHISLPKRYSLLKKSKLLRNKIMF